MSVAVVPISRCGDMAGKGYTLRTGIAAAQEGDTIDLNALPLTCSTITLTGGEIPIPLANLTVSGAIGRTVTVSGNNVGRVFYHTGGGVLTLTGFAVAYGHSVGDGGCIYSNGAPILSQMIVHHCHGNNGGALFAGSAGSPYPRASVAHSSLYANSADGSGGGIRTASGLTKVMYSVLTMNTAAKNGGGASGSGAIDVRYSTVTDNHASDATSHGGGIYASQNMLAHSSTISNNSAATGGGLSTARYGSATLRHMEIIGNEATTTECGGGVYTYSIDASDSTISDNDAPLGGGLCAASGMIYSTTFSGNFSGSDAGGLFIRTLHSSETDFKIANSTVSGNKAVGKGGGIEFLSLVSPTLANDTIAFNTAAGGAGVYVRIAGGSPQITIDATIISHNSNSDASPYADLLLWQYANAPVGFATLIGSASQVPSGNTSGDPLLTPLANHGGPTRTHAILAGSPAIDAGYNPLQLPTDQRGSGYPRVVGITADIGAYERSYLEDEVFGNGFE